ncbi:ZIP family metal transporter [Vulgatibacter sp.]|uniref:ZIP family metal transporter n=1 Tax=Vulgatibacter sp. TaxID=1971226 RepID=UPI003569C750
MTPAILLSLYVVGITGGSLVGAAIPVVFPAIRSRTNQLLSFSAGVMLGAAFFHMLPEALHEGGLPSLSWTLGGFLFLFLLERYVLVHWCKEEEAQGCEVHGLHAHEEGAAHGHDHAPHGTVGVAAFVGMSLHTLADGFALGTAIEIGVGTSVFLAILFHKLPSSFSLAAILLHERYAARRALLLTGLFTLMLPLGATLYFVLSQRFDHERFGAAALAFSAGTFLHLAVADLIPDLHRHKAQRLSLSLALLAGIGVMWALSAFGPAHAH